MRFVFTNIFNPAQWSNETQKVPSHSGLVNLDDWGFGFYTLGNRLWAQLDGLVITSGLYQLIVY